MSKYQTKFNQALKLAENGRSNQSLRVLQQLGAKENQDYCTVVNYGIMCMQQAKFQQARRSFQRAISIDSYQYIAYYNMFVLCCHQLENQKNQVKADYLNLYRDQAIVNKAKQTLRYLYLALSCLYVEIAQHQKDAKLCTKALTYSQENSMAYLNRAILFERDGRLKLSQNDYSSAIYYAPQNSIFYMFRAEFYWKNGKIEQSNQDKKRYWILKNRQSQQKLSRKNRSLKSKEITQEEAMLYQSNLSNKSLELEGLLTKLRNYTLKVQNNWQLKIPASPKKKVNDLVKQQVDYQINVIQKLQSSKQISKEQSKNQDSAFVDESSKNISQQIEKLQYQIRLQRGKLQSFSSQSQSQSQQQSQSQPQPKQNRILNQQILLNSQIQKKTQQIQKIKKLEVDVISNRKSENSSKSRTEQKILTIEEILNYSSMVLQIVSAQFFDSSNKQQSKIYISYGNQNYQTQYSKTNLWRQKFNLNIQHHLHKNYQSALNTSGQVEQDFNQKKLNGEILLELQMKSKSIWSAKKIIGRGSINIQHLGFNKCIISNEKEKTGIIYFKLKLQ